MVRWDAFVSGAGWARGRDLSVGLHVDLGEWILRDGEWEQLYEVVDTDDEVAVRDEVDRQVRRFELVMGRLPTHLDSHQHVHLREPVRTVVLELGRRLGVHVRALSGTSYCGEFYGQWTPGVAHHESISIDALESLIARLPSGTTELACHPGADAVEDVTTMYASERAVERETLCDVRARKAISDHDVVLRSFLPADSVVG
jgi:predicted glycoside hydrolase/deacetylase ChbG (UPF0249 family)